MTPVPVMLPPELKESTDTSKPAQYTTARKMIKKREIFLTRSKCFVMMCSYVSLRLFLQPARYAGTDAALLLYNDFPGKRCEETAKKLI